MGEDGRRGLVLPLVVGVLLALTLLGHGALVLVRFDERIAQAGERLLQARGQARVAVGSMAAAGGVTGRGGGGAAVWLTGGGPAGSHRVVAARQSREWWLLTAEGRDARGLYAHRLLVPVWRAEPAVRVADTRAVVEVAPGATVAVDGVVSGDGYRRSLPGAAGRECGTWRGALDSLGVWSLPPVGEVGGPGPALGLLPLDRLLGLFPDLPEGSGTPGPRELRGRCLEGAWNWGAPGPHRHPCSSRWVARAHRGDLELDGGVGQGVLVVSGDLTARDVDFQGMILVGGAVSLEGAGRLRGLVRAWGGLHLGRDARIDASACAAVLALARADPVLGSTLVPAGAAWPLWSEAGS